MPISYEQWKSEFKQNWESSRRRAVVQALYTTYLGLWLTVTSRPIFQIGTNVYEREWDVLLILDACRADALRAVASEYEFLDEEDVGSIYSVGSGTTEWLCNTFTEDYLDEIAETAYLAAAGYSLRTFHEGKYAPPVAAPFGWPGREVASASDFKLNHNIYDERRDSDLRNVPPDEMVDAAIATWETVAADRYVFHFSQPHTPHIADATEEQRAVTDDEYNPWPYLKNGELDRDEAWRRYLDNLRLALDNIEVLLRNIDAETVVISADHGEAFGELNVHGHPTGFPLPAVRKVPWAETTATNTGDYDPKPIEYDSVMDESLAEQQLKDLGYL